MVCKEIERGFAVCGLYRDRKGGCYMSVVCTEIGRGFAACGVYRDRKGVCCMWSVQR